MSNDLYNILVIGFASACLLFFGILVTNPAKKDKQEQSHK